MKKGWVEKRLEQIGTTQTGTTPKTAQQENYGDFIPFVKPADFNADGSLNYENGGLSEKGVSETRKVAAGSALMVCIGATIGKCGHCEREIATNQQINAITPFNGTSHKFIYYQMLTNDFQRRVSLGSSQATLPIINKSKWSALTVTLPPTLEEQQRIVAILDEAFAAIATAAANAEKNLANARGLFISSLHRVFGIPSADWYEATISELAKHSLGKMLDKQKNRGEFRPYLRNLNVRWFDFDLSDVLEMRFEASEHEKYTAKAGDLLVCEGGYPGRAAIWAGPEVIHFQKAIHRVRCHDPRQTMWLLYFLYYMDATGDIRKYFTGTGIQHFTGKSLSKVCVPIPSPEEIAVQVARFEAIQTGADDLSRVCQQKLTLLTELKQSILHKAFTGELTADPNAVGRTLSEAGV